MHYRFCVMGNPIEHSKSPWIHSQFAKQFQLSVSYIKVMPEIDGYLLSANKFKNEKGYGFNVTFPFKQEAYKSISTKSDRAEIAKSVNTVTIQSDGTFFGDNTDGVGLLNDITKNLNYSLTGKSVVIVGAGGAVRGILEPILAQSTARVMLANRTLKNAQKLAIEFKSYGNLTACDFEDLKKLEIDVIIDGTSFDSHLPFPEALRLSKSALCYDLKYSNNPTPFMIWAKSKECKIVADGLGMLVEQAAEAFFLWTNKKPNTQSVIRLAKETFYV